MKQDELLIAVNLLSLAISLMHQETGLNFIELDENVDVGCGQNKLLGIQGYDTLCFTPLFKRWAQHVDLGVLVNEVNQLSGKGLLIADYVNPKMADKLRKFDVAFIDTAGNAYINEKPLYIFIKGNKHNSLNEGLNIPAKRTNGRAFQPTGLKVIAALMREPELISASYRAIAHSSGVALGTVGWVINELKQDEYLIEYAKKQLKLINKAQLVDKWVSAYLEKLRPKLFLGIFSAENRAWWVSLDDNIVKYSAKWGGELAAAKMNGQLSPENITVYLHKEGGNALLLESGLKKDPHGNIHIYRAFWNDNNIICDQAKTEMMSCVDPLIIMADLLTTCEPNNLDAAKKIKDTYF